MAGYPSRAAAKFNETCNAMQGPTRVPFVLYWISAPTGGWHFLWRDAVRLKTPILEGFTPQLYGPMGLNPKLLKRALRDPRDPLKISPERSQF